MYYTSSMGSSQSSGGGYAHSSSHKERRVASPVVVPICYLQARDSFYPHFLTSLHGALAVSLSPQVQLQKVEGEEYARRKGAGQPAVLCVLCQSAARIDEESEGMVLTALSEAKAVAGAVGGGDTSDAVIVVCGIWAPNRPELRMDAWRRKSSASVGPVYFEADGSIKQGAGLAGLAKVVREKAGTGVGTAASNVCYSPSSQETYDRVSHTSSSRTESQIGGGYKPSEAERRRTTLRDEKAAELKQKLSGLGEEEQALLLEQRQLLERLAEVRNKLVRVAEERNTALRSVDRLLQG